MLYAFWHLFLHIVLETGKLRTFLASLRAEF